MTLKPNAYPEPPAFSWDPVEIRDLLPIYPPPEPFDKPVLPSPPRKPSFDAPWTLTTHLIPACYLRTTRLVPEPQLPPIDTPKEERKKLLLKVRQELDHLRTSKVTDGYPRILWNCVNRYVKKGLDAHNRTGLTLSFQHANGFPKEIFEPVLEELFASPAADIIDEVWVWESVQHGDAALINAASLSGVFDWHDNARDIANFLLHYMPVSATNGPLPTHLPRVSADETAHRIKHGFSHRTFIAVGHSYGGCTSALAASLYPTLFSALYLIDPVIVQPAERSQLTRHGDLALGALSRRCSWPSRAAAAASFAQSPFFSVWDPRVLALYVECGICEDGDGGGVRLKMSGMQEAVVFSESHTEHEVFQRLVGLDPRVALRWVMPGRPGAKELGGPGTTPTRVWVRRENASNIRIAGGGHLIPQEAPKELAEDLSGYLLVLHKLHGTASHNHARANL